jgi:hypothetical protein
VAALHRAGHTGKDIPQVDEAVAFTHLNPVVTALQQVM